MKINMEPPRKGHTHETQPSLPRHLIINPFIPSATSTLSTGPFPIEKGVFLVFIITMFYKNSCI